MPPEPHAGSRTRPLNGSKISTSNLTILDDGASAEALGPVGQRRCWQGTRRDVIRKQDILDRAAEWGLRPEVVEKDYVLGWPLVGITRHRETAAMWIRIFGRRDWSTASGIEFASVPRIESMRNKQAEPTFRARIEYRGPLSMPNNPKVLVDITRFERVEDDAAQRPILHPYPDDLPSGILVSTYSLEELFAEKNEGPLHRLSRALRPSPLEH